MDPRPIGVFDSGFGGLTVARALIDLLPEERLVYVGDTGRYPYGSKPLSDVRAYAEEITNWLIDEHDVKLVVIACNTASAAALRRMQESWVPPNKRVLLAAIEMQRISTLCLPSELRSRQTGRNIAPSSKC